MKVKTIVCKLTLLLTMSLFSAQAATFYVSTSGSDSNPGTSAQPFRTITHAYGLAGPGTTILVLPGVYTDYTSGWGLHLGASGTASSPIVLQSQVRGGAVIDGQNASDRNEAIYIDGSYNVVQGFEIRNGPNGGISIWANGNQILDNEIHHNGNPASTSGNGHDGVYDNENTSGNIYARNYIHNNGRAGGSNLDHVLYLCGNNEWVINNVVTANDSRGLQIAGYTTTSNMKVYNNVFAWNGIDGVTVWQAMNGITIENNIMYQNGRYGVEFYAATGGGVVIDHNLVYGNASGNYGFTDGGSTVGYSLGTTISANPLFVNGASSGFDAHLASGSPAIGAGYNLSSSFATDLAGAARPASGTWDLGAYVHAPSVTIPPTVALTSPVNGASYSAPAAINLAASVTANGHTITQVRFYNGSTLLGSATTAPYALAWNNVAASIYGLTATAVYDAGSTVVSPSTTVSVTNLVASANLTFASTSGTISAPFYVTNGAIAQPAYTGVTAGGQAVYTFNISAAGHYVVSVSVNAPSQNNNSLFLNIDAQPTDPTMIWDIPLTTGFASQTVSWRGNGTVSSTASSGLTAQFAPKVFNLSAGVHQLIIRGREANTQLGTITIAPTSLPAN